MCLARHNNHPTSLASSWDISFLRSLVQQDPKGSDKVAHLFILDVFVSPNRKYTNLSIIYYILVFLVLVFSCPKMTLISIWPGPLFTSYTPQRVIGKTTNQGKILATKDEKWQTLAKIGKIGQIQAKKCKSEQNSVTALFSPPTSNWQNNQPGQNFGNKR